MPDGPGTGLHNISQLSSARTISLSAENPTGWHGAGAWAKEGPFSGAARELGQGWKVSPFIRIPAGSTATVAEIEGPGIVQHIWNSAQPEWFRGLVLRAYWDGEEQPSIEAPLGDFFCQGWDVRCNVNSETIVVGPAGGLGSYWPMPFRKSARITLENTTERDCPLYAYQITAALGEIPDDCGYLHAQFHRSDPLAAGEVHRVLEGVRGHGHYAGVYLAWQSNNNDWWGEGEVKFYLDGDSDHPTICSTGTEDYFGGAWNFEQPTGEYCAFSTPYLGMPQVIAASESGMYESQQRFGLYRWHIPDPVRIDTELRITIQALGMRSVQFQRKYLARTDNIASAAFWYQAEPHAPFPPLPGAAELET